MNRRQLSRLLITGWGSPALSSAAQPAWPTPPVPARPAATRWADPFIGTDGAGQVCPGACVPFGMVMPGPDNADRGGSYSGGYQHRDREVLGFSNTHISGGSTPALGDLLLLPSLGRRWHAGTAPLRARLDKRSERANPGYYSVHLPEQEVRVELTAQQRVALQRYTFAEQRRSQILVDLQHGLAATDRVRALRCEVQVDAARGELSGTIWSTNQVEREASFVLQLDRPIEQVLTLPARAGDQAPRLLLEVEPGATRMVVVRIALSSVDVAGARRNLAAAGRPTFHEVRRRAEQAWGELLGRVQIDADEPTQRIFHSALYRSCLHPSDIADADGRVRGPRGLVLSAPDGRYHSTLALGSTFRALHPLFTLLVPERVGSFVQTLLAHQRQQGYLPLGTLWGRETWAGIGNPALPVIASALAQGFGKSDGFDPAEALEAMVTTASAERPDAPAAAQRSWALLDRFGYLPFDLEGSASVAKTLEHGIGDDAVARVARQLGRDDLARAFAARSTGWRQLFDPATRFVRARDTQGRWREPFEPPSATPLPQGTGEHAAAEAWQHTPTPALHDPEGWRDALGGAAAMREWLDRCFGLPGANGGRPAGPAAMAGSGALRNPPGHHVPWLYAYTDQPWRSHAVVRRIVRECCGDGPGGLAGNDGCGQMSAWLVFATLGLYPVVPASGSYVAGMPLVRESTLALAGGRTLRIVAEGLGGDASTEVEVRLNGQALAPTRLMHEALLLGGTLQFRRASGAKR